MAVTHGSRQQFLFRRVGPLAAALREVKDDALIAKVRERVRTALQKFETPSGVQPGAACWLVEAKM